MNVELIFAKSRLAPVKEISIPRLELMGVLIGVRCLKFLQTQLRLKLEGKYVLTDSQCVLKWIDSEKDLPVFVKNRVREIKESSDIAFGYVKSKENPADVATRGTNVQNLQTNTLWWHGPDWLTNPEAAWQTECRYVAKETTQECSSSCMESAVNNHTEMKAESNTNCNNTTPFDIDYESYNSITKLVRVTALVVRFIRNVKDRRQANLGALLTEEIIEAEKKMDHIHTKESIFFESD